MELVKPEQDPIVNVGIKQSQKEKIVEVIEKEGKHKSINEFVQEAVSNALLNEYKKQESSSSKKNEQKIIFEEINKINTTLLRDELLGFHKLNSIIISHIQKVKNALYEYQRTIIWDTIQELLFVREIKKNLDEFIDILEQENKIYKLGISEHNMSELKSLRDQFIQFVTTQEVKG